MVTWTVTMISHADVQGMLIYYGSGTVAVMRC